MVLNRVEGNRVEYMVRQDRTGQGRGRVRQDRIEA